MLPILTIAGNLSVGMPDGKCLSVVMLDLSTIVRGLSTVAGSLSVAPK